MNALRGFLKASLVLLILIGALTFVVYNYSWVFSKTIDGKVVDVQRVTSPTAILNSRATEAQMYSYSILIQGNDGVLYASSSEDRQWQVVKKGYCVSALLYRYPPWFLDKANTFFNARVEQIRICPGESALPDAPTLPGAPTPPPGINNPPAESEPAVK